MSITLRNELKYNGVWFAHLKGDSFREGNEIHPYHEIIYFQKVKGKFLCEQFETELSDNSVFVIPKNTYHQVIIDDQNEYTRLLINFPDIDSLTDIKCLKEGKIKIINPLIKDIEFIYSKMISSLASTGKNEQNMIFGCFMMLLSEIENADCYTPYSPNDSSRELIKQCLAYIDENFCSELSVNSIANTINVSDSTLYLLFKKNLGITIHKYITEKRIMYAHTKIKEGALPTKIYPECGYKDYATFYKAYVKFFGKAPSENF